MFGDGRCLLAGAVQAEERVRVDLRARPELRPEGQKAIVAEYKKFSKGQVVRRLRPAELPGGVGADERDQRGVQGRQRHPRRGAGQVKKTNIPSIIGGPTSSREGRRRAARSSSSTGSRAASTPTRSTSLAARSNERPVHLRRGVGRSLVCDSHGLGQLRPADRQRPHARERLRARRPRLLDGLRDPQAPQLRPRRRRHGRRVHRLGGPRLARRRRGPERRRLAR